MERWTDAGESQEEEKDERVFSTTNTYRLISQHLFYRKVLGRRPNYIKGLETKS
jgi:hypothetical protein